MRTCSIPECDGVHKARGWCKIHYDRWRHYNGSATKTHASPHTPLLDRLMERIDVGDCWEWIGRTRSNRGERPYGLIDYQGHTLYAHRAVWEALVGPIPDGLTLDHLCRNTTCLNPDHLEAVTPAENVLRGESPRIRKYRKRKRLAQQLRREGAGSSPQDEPLPPASSRRIFGRR